MKLKKLIILLMAVILITSVNAYGAEPKEDCTNLRSYSEGYSEYTNNPYGYEIILPSYLKLNEDIASVKSRFESENLVVEILYDNFHDTLDSVYTYNNYGNSGLKKNSEFKITNEYNHDFDGNMGHIVLYERRKLSSEKTDRNYYATIAFARTSKEVATVFIKSAAPIYIDYIMPSFKFIEKKGKMKTDKVFHPLEKNFDEKTEEFYEKYFKNNEKIDFGIFEPTFPTYKYRLAQLEKLFNYNFPVTLMYNSFEVPYKTGYMNNAKEAGKVVEYTLYTTDKVNGKDKDITLDILDGKYDDYLDNMAKSFNEYDYPVLFRLNNEMNGAWDLYSAYYVGKDTDLFIDCWKYIYERFEKMGVDNLIFIWNPNELSFPNYGYNNYLSYYPGNKYVDVIGLTAYNTGNYYSGETWRTFNEAYDQFYYDYAKRFSHPMMITEFSCSSTGGNKSKWFENMFSMIYKYDRIKLAVLWNGQDYDTTKDVKTISRNYRLDLEDDVIEAVKKGLENYK